MTAAPCHLPMNTTTRQSRGTGSPRPRGCISKRYDMTVELSELVDLWDDRKVADMRIEPDQMLLDVPVATMHTLQPRRRTGSPR